MSDADERTPTSAAAAATQAAEEAAEATVRRDCARWLQQFELLHPAILMLADCVAQQGRALADETGCETVCAHTDRQAQILRDAARFIAREDAAGLVELGENLSTWQQLYPALDPPPPARTVEVILDDINEAWLHRLGRSELASRLLGPLPHGVQNEINAWAMRAGIQALRRQALEASVFDGRPPDLALAVAVVQSALEKRMPDRLRVEMWNRVFPPGSPVEYWTSVRQGRGQYSVTTSEARLEGTWRTGGVEGTLAVVEIRGEAEPVLLELVAARGKPGHAVPAAGPPVMPPEHVCSECGAPLRADGTWINNVVHWQHDCPKARPLRIAELLPETINSLKGKT